MHKRVPDVVNEAFYRVAQAISDTLPRRIYGGKRTVNRRGEKRGCVYEGV